MVCLRCAITPPEVHVGCTIGVQYVQYDVICDDETVRGIRGGKRHVQRGGTLAITRDKLYTILYTILYIPGICLNVCSRWLPPFQHNKIIARNELLPGKAGQGNKTRQGKARQEGKARQGKARQSQGKVRQGKARQGKASQGKVRHGKARQGKVRQGKARQGKARQGKARQGKARQSQAKPSQ